METIAKRRPAPTAVFASTDALAIGAHRWCTDHGWRVPLDVAIIGNDDIEFGWFWSLPLETVHYAADKVIAVDRLIKIIEGKASAPTRRLIEPELVVRNSA